MRYSSAMRAMLRLSVLLLALAAAALSARPPALPGAAGERSAVARHGATGDGATGVAGPETADTAAAKRESPDDRSSRGSRKSHGSSHTEPTRKKLVDTKKPEYRAHGMVRFGGGSRGTGALVGERLIVTALHGHLNQPGSVFYPVYDDDAPDEGREYATVVKWWTAPHRKKENLVLDRLEYSAWTQCHRENDDWVIGLLDKPLGKTYGHLEMPQSYDEIPFGKRIFRYAGYPDHKKLEGQTHVLAWDGTSEVCGAVGYRGPLESDVEPEDGYSGGPLMWRRRLDGLLYVAGLMSADGPRTTYNRKVSWGGLKTKITGVRTHRSFYAGGPDFFKTFWELKDMYEP